MDRAKARLALRLPGKWESNAGVASAIAETVLYRLDRHTFDTFARRVNELTPADLARAASANVDPEDMLWLLAGDRAAIEASLCQLNWSPVFVVNADGEALEGPSVCAAGH